MEKPRRDLGENFNTVCAAVRNGNNVLVLGEAGTGKAEFAQSLYDSLLGEFDCAIAQSKGYDPRELIWQPKFIKKSGAVPDENGELQSATWYVLDWGFRSVSSEEEFQILDNVVAVLSNPEQEASLFDMELENSSICVDGMTQQEILQLLRKDTSGQVNVPDSKALSPAK